MISITWLVRNSFDRKEAIYLTYLVILLAYVGSRLVSIAETHQGGLDLFIHRFFHEAVNHVVGGFLFCYIFGLLIYRFSLRNFSIIENICLYSCIPLGLGRFSCYLDKHIYCGGISYKGDSAIINILAINNINGLPIQLADLIFYIVLFIVLYTLRKRKNIFTIYFISISVFYIILDPFRYYRVFIVDNVISTAQIIYLFIILSLLFFRLQNHHKSTVQGE